MVAYAFAPVAGFPVYSGWTYGFITADGVPRQAFLSYPGYVPPPPTLEVGLEAVSIPAAAVGPTHAISSLVMHTDGKAYSAVNGGANVLIGPWIITPANAPLYEIKMESLSGNPTAGTMNAWMAMSAIRTWTVDQAFVGVRQFVGLLSIRKIATPADILDQCQVTLTCTVS